MQQETTTDLRNLRLDHVGSLLRPQWLRDTYSRHEAGEVSEEQLREAQDKAIRELIAKEEAAGLPIVTDGEYRRVSFMDAATQDRVISIVLDSVGHRRGSRIAVGATR